MRKIIGLFSVTVFAAIVLFSCGSGEDKKEVIVVPAPTQRVIIQEPAKKPTTITVDKNGVKVEVKKVGVVVKKN